MLKGRRCYCDRLYPGFRCAYCRISDVIAHEEQPDPVEQARAMRQAAPEPPTLWSRLSAYGKAVFRSRRSPR